MPRYLRISLSFAFALGACASIACLSFSEAFASIPYGTGILRNVPCVHGPSGVQCGGLVGTTPGVSSKVRLPSDSIIAGHEINASLELTNRTGATITLYAPPHCAPKFTLVITSAAVAPIYAFTSDCATGGLNLHPGINDFSVLISTTYRVCQLVKVAGQVPTCADNQRQHPLPHGRYAIVLVGDGLKVQPAYRILSVTSRNN